MTLNWGMNNIQISFDVFHNNNDTETDEADDPEIEGGQTWRPEGTGGRVEGDDG